MAQTAKLFGHVMMHAFAGLIDWVPDDAVAILVGPDWTPSQDTHEFLDDVTDELSGGSYARVTLDAKTMTYNATTNSANLSCDPISFASMTGDYRYMVVAMDTGTDSTSPLIGWLDFGALETATAQPVNVTPPADGLFEHTVV